MTGLLPSDAVAIGIGAFFGAYTRYQVGRMAAEYIATDPQRFGRLSGWHTAGINIGGSFLLGGISATPSVLGKSSDGLSSMGNKRFGIFKEFQGLSPRAKLMMGVGFCGSYTTFSTYSVDVVHWLQQGKTGRALSYVATNNLGGIAAAAAGMALAKKFFG